MAKILIVDDEPRIRELIREHLQYAGYVCEEAGDGSAALSLLSGGGFDLVILDVMMPFMDGMTCLREMRARHINTPVIILTARGEEYDKLAGLEGGADDYVVKPFGIMEFLSRVRAALRRSAPEEKQNVYAFHEILLDNARHSVTVNGTHIDLTYKEYSLLRLLLENTNLVVTRETILQVVWGTDISVESRTVDMHIRTLRKKLGDAGRYICTVRKVGYKLADNEEGEEE